MRDCVELSVRKLLCKWESYHAYRDKCDRGGFHEYSWGDYKNSSMLFNLAKKEDAALSRVMSL